MQQFIFTAEELFFKHKVQGLNLILL